MSTGSTTTIVHHDRKLEGSSGSVHAPLYTSAEYAFKSSRELTAVFQGKSGYTYSRQGSPTTTALESKITKLESGTNTVSFATGMAALTAVFFTLLQKGDHLISSQHIFGNTNSLLSTLSGLGIQITFVDATNANNVKAAIKENTRMVFTESLANPGTQIADMLAIGDICEEHNLLFVLDNTLVTPWLLQGRKVKAGLTVNSLSKHMGGHGNALGGSVTDTGLFDWSSYPNIAESYLSVEAQSRGLTQIKKKGLRDMGGTLTADAAHRIATGLETLPLRMAAACDNAMKIANELANHPKVNAVHYPGLPSHPQHERAKKLFSGYFGTLLSVELIESINIFDFLDNLKVFALATHLGDNRSLVLPVAHTIYYEMGAQRRAEVGIPDNLLRISVGIENSKDLLKDFTQAIDQSQ